MKEFGNIAVILILVASYMLQVPSGTKIEGGSPLVGSDGKKHDVRQMSLKKPTLFMYFSWFGEEEDVDRKAVANLNRLRIMLAGRVQVVGMIREGDGESHGEPPIGLLRGPQRFARQFHARFLVLDNMDWSQLYGVLTTPGYTSIRSGTNWLVVDGRLVKSWQGYSRDSIRDLKGLLLKKRIEVRSLNPRLFPKQMQAGTEFGSG